MTTSGPTRLDAIRPPLSGAAAEPIHAARRWRALVGEALSSRLPLLEVTAGAWVIGLPSPAWERELASMRQAMIAGGEDVPPLVSRIVARGSDKHGPAPAQTRVPPANGSATERLRWLMEQMCGEDDG